VAVEYPKLRAVEAIPAQDNLVCLRDPQGFSDRLVLLPPEILFVVSLFDGNHSILDIQAEFARRYGDILPGEKIREIVAQLDGALFLDSERFVEARRRAIEDFRAARVRPAAHAGLAYETDPQVLRQHLDRLFDGPEGPGRPAAKREPGVRSADGMLRGLIAPHIDVRRGGRGFAWAYAELARASSARTFVVLGISHVETRRRFVLTAKDFDTPLGAVPTDREFLERLRAGCSSDFFEDEFVHRGEHSVEFQALFLRYLYPGRQDLAIVPVLCSLPPDAYTGAPLEENPEIRQFLAALGAALDACGEEACCLAAVDLSHVGRRFGQDLTLSTEILGHLERDDRAMIRRILERDAGSFYRGICEEKDRRNVCGVPAIYCLLRLLEGRTGSSQLLRYEQAVEEATQSVVSFMAAAFYA
jgi:AmmeMemoRadiSam system protein B